MLPLVASRRAGVVLMHMQGTPATMQVAPSYAGDVVTEVAAFLRARLEAACAAGIDPDRIWLDPGIGFGKTSDHNLALLAGLARLRTLGRPLVIGASRKRFLAAGPDTPDDRLAASLAAATLAAAHGASVVRTHDVGATRRALAVADALARVAPRD